MVLDRKRLLRWALTIGLLLLIPLVATLVSTEFNWDVMDFLIVAAALSGIGLTYEVIVRKSASTVYRGAFAIGLVAAFLLFWVNGAVGIIGHEGQDVNLLFAAVFLVAITGAIVSRFKAKGMSRVLYITVLVQMLIPVSALILWPPVEISWSPSVLGVFLLCGFFALLFVVSGMLFHRAAKDDA